MTPATSRKKSNGEYQTSSAEKARRCNRLLDQAAHLLNHGQPIGGLHTRALEAIVENGILVDGYIECGSLAHDLNTDMVGITIGKKIVEVVDRTRHETGGDGQHHLCADKIPEVPRKRLMEADAIDAIDDSSRNDADANRKKCNDDANRDVPEDNCWTRLPDKMKYGGNVFESVHAIRPGTTRRSRSGGSTRRRLTVSLLKFSVGRHRSIFAPLADTHIVQRSGARRALNRSHFNFEPRS